jgi:hypothetical protein
MYPFYGLFELGKVIGFYGIYAGKDLLASTSYQHTLLWRGWTYHGLGGLKPRHRLDSIPDMM